MVCYIVGGGHLSDTLRRELPDARWRVPSGRDPVEQAHWLTTRPVPPGRHGFVFASQSAPWAQVRDAGWRVYWVGDGREPFGTEPLPAVALQAPVSDLAYRFWHVRVADKRLVIDVIEGRTRRAGTVLCVTSNTGGVGKTVSSRRLAERAAQQGLATLLVDGNMLQSSQRSFFDPAHNKPLATIHEWRGDDARNAVNRGRTLGVPYDVTFAPPVGVTVAWGDYMSFIREARKLWQFVVLDLDRISAADFNDPSTAATNVVQPFVTGGDPMLLIVKAGVQTQGDALGLLAAFPDAGLPRELVGIKDTIPVEMDGQYHRLDYTRYGTFLGAERQSAQAGQLIARGESGWSDPGLDVVRERVLAWALPDAGFDPRRVEAAVAVATGGGRKGKGRRR